MDSGAFIDPAALLRATAASDPSAQLGNTMAFADSLQQGEESLFTTEWDLDDSPPPNGLYSTPLSWDPPMPKVEDDSPATAPSASYPTSSSNTLTRAQQEELRSIAMPPGIQYKHRPSSTSSASPNHSNSASSPETAVPSRKRKSSTEGEEEEEDEHAGQGPPVKKTAHNMIEKRYRTNLNDKIADLRDSVPSLRIMTKSQRGEDTTDDREDLQGLTPAHKLNKATILSKATEYIRHLEKRNSRLQDENAIMKARINAFEKLFMSGSMGVNAVPQLRPPFSYPQYAESSSGTPVEPQGMIQVPEEMRRMHPQMSQQAYPVPQEHYPPPRPPYGQSGWQNRGGAFGKLMVGSLAGLMVMEGFREQEQDTNSPAARGLFSVPTQLLYSASQKLHSGLHFNVAGHHISAAQSIGYIKILLVIGVLLYVFLPSFTSKPKPKDGKTQSQSLTAAPSLASSIHVRRQAWLTAIQTVWVPRHNFFLEAAALCLKMAKLSLRNTIGTKWYTFLTGTTDQQEAARVRAWEIALDAQLAGGDVEVNKSRLTLTLLASGTLPDTPARFMLKALHIRVLLWELGNSGFASIYRFQEIAAKLARWQWKQAQEMQNTLALNQDSRQDELPPHLAALLEQDCDDVLIDCIGQRAHNLTWNLPTTHNLPEFSDSMDSVVDDFAVRGPLDAVAAWWSSYVLQRALSHSLASYQGLTTGDIDVENDINKDIDLAIKTAPIGSGAQIRALVARAVLVKEKRGSNIATASQTLGPLESPMVEKSKELAETPAIISKPTSTVNLPEINLSIQCANAIAELDCSPPPADPHTATDIINSIVPTGMNLLGFTSLYMLVEKIRSHETASQNCAKALEGLAGKLRIWIGGRDAENSGLDVVLKGELVEKCLKLTREAVGMEGVGVDDGYGTMSDDDCESDAC
ncbi:hypothetical protein F5884DRAFT_792454 [Xylogone sp. PMI_703]|nr:hypothetical protein F5884DRAFT_792454 [Xylogone sp. PMI_703]